MAASDGNRARGPRDARLVHVFHDEQNRPARLREFASALRAPATLASGLLPIVRMRGGGFNHKDDRIGWVHTRHSPLSAARRKPAPRCRTDPSPLTSTTKFRFEELRMNRRDELTESIFRTVPEDRLAVAAAVAMQSRTGATYATEAELDAFIRSLSIRELKLLRKLALSLIDQGSVAELSRRTAGANAGGFLSRGRHGIDRKLQTQVRKGNRSDVAAIALRGRRLRPPAAAVVAGKPGRAALRSLDRVPGRLEPLQRARRLVPGMG